MKTYNKIGTKERLFEMMNKLNNISINENFQSSNDENVAVKAIQNLINNKLNIGKTNTISNGNDSFVEIVGTNENGEQLEFRFKVSASTDTLDDVYSLTNITLISLKYLGEEITSDSSTLKAINARYAQNLIDIISDYVNFDSEVPSIDEEYNDAIQKIDSYPFTSEPRTMQTGVSYAIEKPVNDKLRVNSPELNMIIDEEIIPVDKTTIIKDAIKFVDNSLANENKTKADISIRDYIFLIKHIANDMFNKTNTLTNEGAYPNQIGRKFKSKFNSRYPEIVKKRKNNIVRISEELDINDVNTDNKLIGGLGDNHSAQEFNPEQIKLGIGVEMEHTNDPSIALDIVIDHLTENPEYYTSDGSSECSAQQNAKKDADDIELTNILLGFTPKNVGD